MIVRRQQGSPTHSILDEVLCVRLLIPALWIIPCVFGDSWVVVCMCMGVEWSL
jgi:hypothetical protein